MFEKTVLPVHACYMMCGLLQTEGRIVPSRYMQAAAAKAKGPMKADRVSVIVVFSSLLGCLSTYH